MGGIRGIWGGFGANVGWMNGGNWIIWRISTNGDNYSFNPTSITHQRDIAREPLSPCYQILDEKMGRGPTSSPPPHVG